MSTRDIVNAFQERVGAEVSAGLVSKAHQCRYGTGDCVAEPASGCSLSDRLFRLYRDQNPSRQARCQQVCLSATGRQSGRPQGIIQ